MKWSDHVRLGYARDHAFIHRRRCCDAQSMSIQASFPEKLTGFQHCDDGFLALLGNHRELDGALLDVKNGVRDVSLRENNLILVIVGYGFPVANLGEKFL